VARTAFDALAHVEDHRPRLDAIDRAGDQLALAVGELVENRVALGLAEALEDDLLGGLGADAAEASPSSSSVSTSSPGWRRP
jgi:hypothetical protein